MHLPPPAWGVKSFGKAFAGRGAGSEIFILVGGVVLLGESNFAGGNGGVREFRRKIENCIIPVYKIFLE